MATAALFGVPLRGLSSEACSRPWRTARSCHVSLRPPATLEVRPSSSVVASRAPTERSAARGGRGDAASGARGSPRERRGPHRDCRHRY